jgi:hypothetical protein
MRALPVFLRVLRTFPWAFFTHNKETETMKTERTKYDDENPFYWLLIVCFAMFFYMQWVDSRPTHFKPRRSSHATSSQYGR